MRENLIAANDNGGLRYLSVCSGIEAATVAWKNLNWKCIGVAEIEPFPCLVLNRHYGATRPLFMPDPAEPGIKVKEQRSRQAAIRAVSVLPEQGPLINWGDFTKIDVTTLGRVDILAGGTPCQAFSVAGLRQSLADARGNLSLEFVRLAHELADRNGLRNAVWENVVGVLSTKDNAFGCFLAGLVGADAAIEPPARGKWPRHGMVSGPKGRAAWAVKDAQFFGVAQRRRRVLVVADFGNGADPAAVLFEPEGVFRHSPPSRETGKDFAGVAAGGSGGGGELTPSASIAPCLRARSNASHRLDTEAVVAYAPEIARCVATREGSSQDYETTTMVAVNVHPINTQVGLRHEALGEKTGLGIGKVGDPAFTISKSHSHAVCITGTITHALKAEGADASEDGSGRGTPIIAYAPETAPSMVAQGDNHKGFRDEHGLVAQSVSIRGRDGGATAELGGPIATALRASHGGGDKPYVLTSTVRRLTPVECERLQGFPDGYTRIQMRSYATKKTTKNRPDDMWELIDGQWWLMSADGPRYKALGNSWAVPKFTWLGKRIQALMPANDNLQRSDSDSLAA